jgi:hypothetical protein
VLAPHRSPARAAAWRALWTSRLLVWAAAVAGIFGIGTGTYERTHTAGADPAASVGGLLLSPVNRWDAGWYLAIAEDGYDLPDARPAFFPLYPLLIRLVGTPIDALGVEQGRAFELAGVLISLVAFLVGLQLLHRLTEIELGLEAANNTVLLLAFFPMSFYFSAIYSEALFLALSVASVYEARRSEWWRAGLLAALATATRSQGVCLVVPIAIMLLYGPRSDQPPAQAVAHPWSPRYRPRLRELGAVLLVPVGIVAHMAYLRVATRYGLLAPFKAQETWMREFKGPIIGIWGGVKNAVLAIRDLASGASLRAPVSGPRESLLNFAALAVGSVGVAGALRRLPVAYGAYALAGLLLAISFPTVQLQLYSLPRVIMVLFPIFMSAGYALTGSRLRSEVLAASAVGLACFSAAFATGYWVA